MYYSSHIVIAHRLLVELPRIRRTQIVTISWMSIEAVLSFNGLRGKRVALLLQRSEATVPSNCCQQSLSCGLFGMMGQNTTNAVQHG